MAIIQPERFSRLPPISHIAGRVQGWSGGGFGIHRSAGFHKCSSCPRRQIDPRLGPIYQPGCMRPTYSPFIPAICVEGYKPLPVKLAVPDREQSLADSYERPRLLFDDAFEGLPTFSLWPPSWGESRKKFSYENFWDEFHKGGVYFPGTEILKKFPCGSY
jgi:hypothetical protein